MALLRGSVGTGPDQIDLEPDIGIGEAAYKMASADLMRRISPRNAAACGCGMVAKALTFICGADRPTTVALNLAAESGSDRDIKKARALFLKLKSGDRNAALAMIDD